MKEIKISRGLHFHIDRGTKKFKTMCSRPTATAPTKLLKKIEKILQNVTRKRHFRRGRKMYYEKAFKKAETE